MENKYDTQQTGNGGVEEPKQLNMQPPGAFAILPYAGDKILVIKDCRPNGKWGLPGGAIEEAHNELETPFVAAAREVKEELNLNVGPISARYIGMFGKLQPVHLVYFPTWGAVGPEGKDFDISSIVMQPGEVSEWKLLSLRDAIAGPKKYEREFYPAQWKMIGWFMAYKQNKISLPIFGQRRCPWEEGLISVPTSTSFLGHDHHRYVKRG